MGSPQCLHDLLIQDEGLKLKSYVDTEGKTTVGVGRNITDVGISFDEAMVLLDSDIRRARQAAQTLPWFSQLNAARQDVVLNMIFNLGLGGFLEFKSMTAALSEGKYAVAAEEMLSSHWASQVGDRAKRLAQMMTLGIYPA